MRSVRTCCSRTSFTSCARTLDGTHVLGTRRPSCRVSRVKVRTRHKMSYTSYRVPCGDRKNVGFDSRRVRDPLTVVSQAYRIYRERDRRALEGGMCSHRHGTGRVHNHLRRRLTGTRVRTGFT